MSDQQPKRRPATVRMWPADPLVYDVNGDPIAVAAPFVMEGDATDTGGVVGWITHEEEEQ